MDNERKSYVLRSLADRIILINGDITFITLIRVQQALFELQDDNFKDILVIIRRSKGGSGLAGMMISNTIQNSIAPCHTLVEKYACSAAFNIFMSGKKRVVVEGARLQPHGATIEFEKPKKGSISFTQQQLETHSRNALTFNTAIAKIASKVTGLTSESIRTLYFASPQLTCAEAQSLGIATHIIKRAKLAKNLKNTRLTRYR